MIFRKLGQNGPTVSAIGLGCMGMSEFYGSTDDKQSIRTIHQALDEEVNFLDPADMYGMGHNESLVGRAIKDQRDKVILATKFGNVRGSDGSFKGVDENGDDGGLVIVAHQLAVAFDIRAEDGPEFTLHAVVSHGAP